MHLTHPLTQRWRRFEEILGVFDDHRPDKLGLWAYLGVFGFPSAMLMLALYLGKIGHFQAAGELLFISSVTALLFSMCCMAARQCMEIVNTCLVLSACAGLGSVALTGSLFSVGLGIFYTMCALGIGFLRTDFYTRWRLSKMRAAG